MTEKEIDKLVERNLKSGSNQMIDTETGLDALDKIAETAKKTHRRNGGRRIPGVGGFRFAALV